MIFISECMTSKTDAGIIQKQKDAEGFGLVEYELDENGDPLTYEYYDEDYGETVVINVTKLDENDQPIFKTRSLEDILKLTNLGLFIATASRMISLFPLNFKWPRAFGSVRS